MESMIDAASNLSIGGKEIKNSSIVEEVSSKNRITSDSCSVRVTSLASSAYIKKYLQDLILSATFPLTIDAKVVIISFYITGLEYFSFLDTVGDDCIPFGSKF